MVFICNMPFTQAAEAQSADTYDGKCLSDFQKWAIQAIKTGNHVLITAHTGSGKTLPAEYAIQYFTARGKKVIYASPIKALSNQKLFDFRRKFPTISFGIMTGDCKDNPDADVLIMTTEILRNSLIVKTSSTASANTAANASASQLNFPLADLAAVIFDEVHYINDPERGSVWEQSILLLPPHVQLIMLSATIDRAEVFAEWIETEKQKQWLQLMPDDTAYKNVPQVYLASTTTRVVPLTHYMWFSVHEGTVKKAASAHPIYEKKIELLRKTLVPIATSDGLFREDNYYKMHDCLDYLHKQRANFIKRQFVLNDLLTYLKSKEMLPAICFVFSRKQVEQTAKEINFSLFADEHAPSNIEKECRHILQTKFKNYQEYLDLPEYHFILQLLEKGIAIHHAGILPVLREMVELLFEKGFIRLLLATETFAVGLNMPTKTVIFMGLNKFNGQGMRLLYPHEYIQMAGRAGRRGFDTVGHVIHCVNLFELPTATEYKQLLTGSPQVLTSKFKFSFSMALTMIAAKQDMHSFMTQSLLSSELRREIKGYDIETVKVQEVYKKKLELVDLGRTPHVILQQYHNLFEKLPHMTNGAKKKVRQELSSMEAEHKFLLADLIKFNEIDVVENKIRQLQEDRFHNVTFVENYLAALALILEENGFIIANVVGANVVDANVITTPDPIERVLLTTKGHVAALLQEVHPLALTDLYYKTEQFSDLSAHDLAGLFSCFYPLNVSDELRVHQPPKTLLYQTLVEDLLRYERSEEAGHLNTGSQYELAYDLMPFVVQWCQACTEPECKLIIQEMKEKTGTFLGEFIKALLKINAIAAEFEQVCEITQNMALLEKIRDIPRLTLKYVATNQSLYL